MIGLAGGASSPGGYNKKRNFPEPRELLQRRQFQILRFGRHKEFNLRPNDFLVVCSCHRIPRCWLFR
jgi:hypothetical protein